MTERHAAQAPALRERHPPIFNFQSSIFIDPPETGIRPDSFGRQITPDDYWQAASGRAYNIGPGRQAIVHGGPLQRFGRH